MKWWARTWTWRRLMRRVVILEYHAAVRRANIERNFSFLRDECHCRTVVDQLCRWTFPPWSLVDSSSYELDDSETKPEESKREGDYPLGTLVWPWSFVWADRAVRRDRRRCPLLGSDAVEKSPPVCPTIAIHRIGIKNDRRNRLHTCSWLNLIRMRFL